MVAEDPLFEQSEPMIVPRALSESDRIVFLHIPKTAGSSTMFYFIDMFGRSNVGWLGHDFTVEDLADGRCLERFRVIGGHFTKADAVHWRFPKIYVSIVREPVDRILSYYQHIRNTEGEPERLGITGDLDSDLDGAFGQLVQDQQSSFLGFSARGFGRGGRTGICRIQDAPAFLACLARKLNLATGTLSVSNARQGPELSVGEATRARISRLTQLDSRLYKLAKMTPLQRLRSKMGV